MRVDPEVLVVGVYAILLVGVAAVLDAAGKHTQRRSERFRTAGFSYHPQHDAWTCSQDEMLWPMDYDEQHHLVRYRAKASVCNSCHVKPDCTSSTNGREVTRAVAPWPHSEAGRFHRGMSLALVGLAAVLILVTGARHPQPSTLVLGLPLLLTVLLGRRYSAHFRATPANFPAPTAATGLRVTPTSRTRWGSDARDDLS
jgi:Flp pilus assembly protein TadB